MLLADTDVVALTYYPASSDNDCSHARVRAGHAPSLLGEGRSPLHELSIMLVERHNKTPWPSVQGISRIGTPPSCALLYYKKYHNRHDTATIPRQQAPSNAAVHSLDHQHQKRQTPQQTSWHPHPRFPGYYRCLSPHPLQEPCPPVTSPLPV